MAVNIVKSGILTNRDASPPKPNDLRTAGRNFQKRGRVLTVTGDSIASQYGFFSLPYNAVITSAELSCAALGGTTAGDLGLWETVAKGGFSATTGWLTQAGAGLPGVIANAKQYFGAAVSLVAAQTKTQVQYNNAAFITLLNCDQMIWQQIGLTTDPMAGPAIGSVEYDVVLTLTAAVTAGGSVLLEVTYKLQ